MYQNIQKELDNVWSVSSLKKIGLAIQHYHHVRDTFPPAWLADENGNPRHSWRVLILPHLGYRDLYDRYDFGQPWNSEANKKFVDLIPNDPV